MWRRGRSDSVCSTSSEKLGSYNPILFRSTQDLSSVPLTPASPGADLTRRYSSTQDLSSWRDDGHFSSTYLKPKPSSLAMSSRYSRSSIPDLYSSRDSLHTFHGTSFRGSFQDLSFYGSSSNLSSKKMMSQSTRDLHRDFSGGSQSSVVPILYHSFQDLTSDLDTPQQWVKRELGFSHPGPAVDEYRYRFLSRRQEIIVRRRRIYRDDVMARRKLYRKTLMDIQESRRMGRISVSIAVIMHQSS